MFIYFFVVPFYNRGPARCQCSGIVPSARWPVAMPLPVPSAGARCPCQGQFWCRYLESSARWPVPAPCGQLPVPCARSRFPVPILSSQFPCPVPIPSVWFPCPVPDSQRPVPGSRCPVPGSRFPFPVPFPCPVPAPPFVPISPGGARAAGPRDRPSPALTSSQGPARCCPVYPPVAAATGTGRGREGAGRRLRGAEATPRMQTRAGEDVICSQ